MYRTKYKNDFHLFGVSYRFTLRRIRRSHTRMKYDAVSSVMQSYKCLKDKKILDAILRS